MYIWKTWELVNDNIKYLAYEDSTIRTVCLLRKLLQLMIIQKTIEYGASLRADNQHDSQQHFSVATHQLLTALH